jgi:hypothetical protein
VRDTDRIDDDLFLGLVRLFCKYQQQVADVAQPADHAAFASLQDVKSSGIDLAARAIRLVEQNQVVFAEQRRHAPVLGKPGDDGLPHARRRAKWNWKAVATLGARRPWDVGTKRSAQHRQIAVAPGILILRTQILLQRPPIDQIENGDTEMVQEPVGHFRG